MSNAFCPISYKKIDEHVARFNASLTVVLLLVYVLTSSLIPVAFLLVDFFLRGIEKPAYSPLAIVARWILSLAGVKAKPINAGPKIFAARVGVLFSVLILGSALAGWTVSAWIFTAIFGICAFLEAVVGFCVACKLYPLLYKLVYQSGKLKTGSDWQI